MPLPTLIDLAGANPSSTILDNLKSAPPAAQATISAAVNANLKTQLAAQLTGTPVLAGLVENMPVADIAAAQNLTIPDFIKQQLDPMVAKDPAMQQALDGEIAQLTTAVYVTHLRTNSVRSQHAVAILVGLGGALNFGVADLIVARVGKHAGFASLWAQGMMRKLP